MDTWELIKDNKFTQVKINLQNNDVAGNAGQNGPQPTVPVSKTKKKKGSQKRAPLLIVEEDMGILFPPQNVSLRQDQGQGQIPVLQNRQSNANFANAVLNPAFADGAYQSFIQAKQSLGTDIGFFDSRDLVYVKKKLQTLDALLGTKPSAYADRGGFAGLKRDILLRINEIHDACRFYMEGRREKEENPKDKYYRNVGTVAQRLAGLRTFYESFSPESFDELNKDRSLGRIMSSDHTRLTKDPGRLKEAGLMTLGQEHLSAKKRIESLVEDGDAGGAGELVDAFDDHKELLEEGIPSDDGEFLKSREELCRSYEKLITECKNYCRDKTTRFSRGKKRLDTVRMLWGIFERELSYVSRLDQRELTNNMSLYGSWDQALSPGTQVVSRNDLQKNDAKESFEEGTAMGTFALSHLLGQSDLFLKRKKAMRSGSKGKITRGFLVEKPVISEKSKKGIKEWKDVLSFARKQKLDTIYSHLALKQLSTIGFMDFLSGRTKRDKDSFLYDVDIRTVDGEDVVSINRVISKDDSRTFSNEGGTDPSAFGLTGEDGKLLLSYDTKFADRIMQLGENGASLALHEMGVELAPETEKIFRERFAKLKQLFEYDMKKGWRSDLDDEDRSKEEKKADPYARLANGRDIARGFRRAKSIPSYVFADFVRDRKERPEPKDFANDTEKDETWMDSRGTVKKSVGMKQKLMTKKDRDELERQLRSQNLSEAEIRKRVREASDKAFFAHNKEKIELMRKYQRTGSTSAFKMKNSKAKLLERVTSDRDELGKGMSAEFDEITTAISEYANILATAQWDMYRQWKERKVKNILESSRTRRIRIYTPVFINEEKEKLKEARRLIGERITTLTEKKSVEGLSDAEKKELDKLEVYSKYFVKHCDGGLKLSDDYKQYSNYMEEEKTPLLSTAVKKDKFDYEVLDKQGKLTHVPSKYEFTYIGRYDERDERDTPLFAHKPCMEDVAQGGMGDCYFLAALAGLAEKNPEAIMSLMVDNGDGSVTVKLHHIDGRPVYVRVQKKVPIDKQTGRDSYAQGCLWVQMFERAFAVSDLAKEMESREDINEEDDEKADNEFAWATGKLRKMGYRTYRSLKGGDPGDAMKILLGRVEIENRTYFHSDEQFELLKEQFKKRDESTGRMDTSVIKQQGEVMVREIETAEKEGKIIYAGARSNIRELTDEEDKDSLSPDGVRSLRGVRGKHAYTVLGIRRIGGEPFIAVRNPWGDGVVEHYMNETTGGITYRKGGDADTGAFLLTPAEFAKYFEGIQTVGVRKGH